MTMKRIQRELLNARIPAKVYTKPGNFWGVLIFRCRFRDRKRIRELMEAIRPASVKFVYRPTLMPWECRDLMKVVSYV